MQRRRTTDERRTNDGQRTTLERRTNDERTTNDALTNEVFRWILDFGFRLWTLDSSFGFGFRVCGCGSVFCFWLSGFRFLVFLFFVFFVFGTFVISDSCEFRDFAFDDFGFWETFELSIELSNFRSVEFWNLEFGILVFCVLVFWCFGNCRTSAIWGT